MQRPNRPAALRLVARPGPVANYSYPRNDSVAPYSARSSLASEASMPDLDDGTDSDDDDDFQYHAHMAELWDSFWPAAAAAAARPGLADEPPPHPRKLYPALIPSPRSSRRRQRQPAAWPLPDASPPERNRKPAAAYVPSPSPSPSPTYSAFPAFPRPVALPPASLATVMVSRLGASSDEPVAPSIRLVPSGPRHAASACARAGADNIPDGRPPPSPVHPPPPPPPAQRVPRHCKSIASLVPRPPEPQSVFEYDSDSESDHSRSFFRFHRRSDCDSCRAAKASVTEAPSRDRRHARALTAPSRLGKQDAAAFGRKRQGHDVFGRMLGRRSR